LALFTLRHVAPGGLVRSVDRVALGGTRQVDYGLGNSQFALGATKALLHLPGLQGQGQCPRIGITDVLAGHAHNATRYIQRITTAIQHTTKPVQSRIRRAAPDSLMQRTDLVVKQITAFVETA